MTLDAPKMNNLIYRPSSSLSLPFSGDPATGGSGPRPGVGREPQRPDPAAEVPAAEAQGRRRLQRGGRPAGQAHPARRHSDEKSR